MAWKYHSYSFEVLKDTLNCLYNNLLPKCIKATSKAARKDNAIVNMITINHTKCVVTVVNFNEETGKDELIVYCGKTKSTKWTLESLGKTTATINNNPWHVSYGFQNMYEVFKMPLDD